MPGYPAPARQIPLGRDKLSSKLASNPGWGASPALSVEEAGASCPGFVLLRQNCHDGVSRACGHSEARILSSPFQICACNLSTSIRRLPASLFPRSLHNGSEIAIPMLSSTVFVNAELRSANFRLHPAFPWRAADSVAGRNSAIPFRMNTCKSLSKQITLTHQITFLQKT